MTPKRSTAGRLALGLALALVARAADENPPPTLKPGAPAPAFSLPGVDGRTWSLSDFKDANVLVVVFTANHCPTAQYYEDRLKQLMEDYRGKGVRVVAISPNDPDAVRPDELGYTDLGDTLEEMKVRSAHRGYNFPYLFGGGEHEAVSRAYGPVATPHAFVFDAERRLRYTGRIDDAERIQFLKTQDLRIALDALIAGQAPPVTQTKVFGCSTKWSSKRSGVKEYWDKAAKEPVKVELAGAETLKALRRNAGTDAEPAKLRLINVWATFCGPCVTEFPELMTIQRMYRGREFELVTVAAQYPDEQKQVLKVLTQQKASTRNYLFGTTNKYELMETLDPDWDGALPYTVLVDADGKVLYRKQGEVVEPLELRRIIVAELNRRKPW